MSVFFGYRAQRKKENLEQVLHVFTYAQLFTGNRKKIKNI